MLVVGMERAEVQRDVGAEVAGDELRELGELARRESLSVGMRSVVISVQTLVSWTR